jgi:hypothetical protein
MGDSLEERTHEVHLTVQLNERTAAELATFADAHGCRLLLVVLDAGAHRSHPMLSWQQGPGLDRALERAATIAAELDRQGMKSTRIKIEASPLLELDAKYFEAHFKVEVNLEQGPELERLAGELGVHLSRNAHSRSADAEHRFLTARHPARSVAEPLFDRVEAALRRGGWRLLSVDREAVLHDSNLGLDEGWSS